MRIKEGLEKASSLQPGKSEINNYSSSVATLSENEDPISFWVNNEAAYPLLTCCVSPHHLPQLRGPSVLQVKVLVDE